MSNLFSSVVLSFYGPLLRHETAKGSYQDTLEFDTSYSRGTAFMELYKKRLDKSIEHHRRDSIPI